MRMAGGQEERVQPAKFTGVGRCPSYVASWEGPRWSPSDPFAPGRPVGELPDSAAGEAGLLSPHAPLTAAGASLIFFPSTSNI